MAKIRKSSTRKNRPGGKSKAGEIDEPEFDRQLGGGIGRVIGGILTFPFAAVASIFRPLFSQDVVVEGDEKKSAIAWRLVKAILLFPFRLLKVPFQILGLLASPRWRESLYAIPALVMMVFLGFVAVNQWSSADMIRRNYQNGFNAALEARDYQKARTYFSRIKEFGNLTENQKFQWALVLDNTGDKAKYNEILDELAPEDNLGFGPAHATKALELIRELNQGEADESTLKRIRKHLTRTNVESLPVLQAWAVYYQRTDQPDRAIEVLRKAADMNPNLYLVIAAYEEELVRPEQRQRTLVQAADVFQKTLDEDPLDLPTRVALAKVRVQQDRVDDAEKLLKLGLKAGPNPELKRALADFYVMRYRRAREDNEVEADELDYLFQALYNDPNFPPIYQELINIYMAKDRTPEQQERIRKQLLDLVTRENPSPMAHFSLSNVLYDDEEKERAKYHLERAKELAPGLVAVVNNNLAWMMSQEQNPNLDRAMELIEESLDAKPGDQRFLDTRGSILLLMGRFEEAVVDLKKALSGVQNKRAVRIKLAEAYKQMGMDDLAEMELEKAQAEANAN